jgi:serine phosphatase RsbU (regulator of sigma subunit)
LFSHSLFVSVVPQVTCQLHAAFGSNQLFDNHFNIAYFMKIVAYTVPLLGLLLDYTRAYQAEAALLATQEKLRFARRVQQNLLPTSAPRVSGFDVAGVSYPAEAVGGDYFDYIPMHGGGYGVVVADVSGHDLGASIFMAQTRAYLRALAHAHGDVGEIVRILNRNLVADTKDRRFVTLFFARIDPDSGKVVYVAQGHQAYVLRRSGEAETLHAGGPPLGLLDSVEISCGPALELKSGDLLLELTDGIMEAQAPNGEQFGIERTLRCVAEHRDKSAREIVDVLWHAVQNHCGNLPQADDVTAVVLKATRGS